MTAKFFRGLAALLVLIVAIAVGPIVCKAQDSASPKSGSGQQAPAKINKAEEEAYKALVASQGSDPAALAQKDEDFIKKFPSSRYLAAVYAQLTTAYYKVGDEDKVFTAGAKAIELNPDNVDVLALLANMIPRRVKPTTPDSAQLMANAEAYARHAIELIPNMPKPPGIDDAAFEQAKNGKLSMAHSGLGLIDYDHSKYDDARTELMLAVQLSPAPDPVDYYLLGNADERASYYNDAAAAFDKCATTGPLTQQCKSLEETAKKDAATKMGR